MHFLHIISHWSCVAFAVGQRACPRQGHGGGDDGSDPIVREVRTCGDRRSRTFDANKFIQAAGAAVNNNLSIRFSGSERRYSVKTLRETLEERLELPAPKKASERHAPRQGGLESVGRAYAFFADIVRGVSQAFRRYFRRVPNPHTIF